MTRIFLFFLIICLFSTNLQAQNGLLFSHLGTDNGFTFDKANTIVQDKKGFIWVGTWNGLNRYDGYNCITYQPQFHDSTSISNREITELMVDSNGNLWIGTASGLNFMNLETGKIKKFDINKRILSLCEDHQGHIWIGTWSGGLLKLDTATSEITTYLENEVISDIYEDSRKILWIASYNALLKFDPGKDDFTRYVSEPGKNSISNNTVTQIVESADGSLWIGTWSGGLNKAIVDETGEIVEFLVYQEKSKNSDRLKVVYRLFYDQFDNLWIGSWINGLSLLTKDQQQLPPGEARFLSYYEQVDNPGSLSGNNVAAVYVDRNGLLWVGAGMIDRASIADNDLSRYVIPLRVDHAGNRIYIRCLAEYQNQLWIGTTHNLLQYEKQNGVYTLKADYGELSYFSNGKKYTAYTICDMFADSSGLWLGTEDAGIIHYPFFNNLGLDTKKGTVFTRDVEPSLSGNKISEICPSKIYPGVIYAGVNEVGFIKMERSAGGRFSVKKFFPDSDNYGLSNNIIRSVYEDNDGLVWIGTENGLNCFDPKTERFNKYFYSPEDTNSLNNNAVNAITEDSSGNLWIGTNSGINKKIVVRNSEGHEKIKFKGYPGLRYLSNEFISGLIQDREGHIWVRLYRGIIKFDIKKEEVVGEYFSQDYKNERLERNTELMLSNGELILANLANFVSLHPDSISKTSHSQVEITDILIYNVSIFDKEEIRNKYGVNTMAPYLNQVQLSHNDKMATFIFSAMDYKNPEKNTYCYKLEGFDDQWNFSDGRNSATYTNIPPGRYTFKVCAINSEKIKSDQITAISVMVTPPWWKTNVAYILYGLLFAALLYLYHRYSVVRAKERHSLAYEKMKSEELQRLNEQRSLFFTDITHELRTPLTLILGPSQELSADNDLKPHAKKQAEFINNSAHKLLRLVNQLMEFRKIEKGAQDNLNIMYCNLADLVNNVAGFFQPMADSRNIDYSVDCGQEPVMAFFDQEKIEKVIFNLLSNAFKYTADNGKIAVGVKKINNNSGNPVVLIEVTDNGVGIAKEFHEKVFERYFQIHQVRTQSTGGIGLFLAKALVEQHGGTIEIESVAGEGSCFKVLLPADSSVEEKDASMIIGQDAQTSNPSVYNQHVSKVKNITASTDHDLSILIVEDDVDLNNYLVSGLAESFHVDSAFNGKEALRKLRNQPPDLIITDIMMPEMDGFEFCQALRKNINLSHIPVILLTAKTMHEDEMKGLKLGAVDYIYKPFNLISLKLKIQNLLTSQKQIQEYIKTEQKIQPGHIELSSLDDKFLADAVEAVNQNLDKPEYDVEAFSADLKVNPNQVYRKIKALTGQTAKEFIRNQRLKVAADLLVQQKRSISEVIYMVGFASPSYFSRCFKEYYGCTPKKYIEKNRRVKSVS